MEREYLAYEGMNMWLAMLGLMNGIIMGLVYSVEELWIGSFFVLIPFAGILFSKKKISFFLIGYGLGYYITGLSFLFSLTDVVPLPIYTANVLFAGVILAISIILTFLMWIALYPFQYWRRGSSIDIFLLAGLYTLGEWLQEIVPMVSFPWFRLAVPVVKMPIFIQGASLFGSLFVSFCVILWNTWLAKLIMKRKLDCSMVLAGTFIGAVLLYGEVRLYQKEEGTKQVLIVQGNHEGSEKWAMESKDILKDYKKLAYQYANPFVELIIMPETALPYAVMDEKEGREELMSISKQLSAELLVGAIQKEEIGEETNFYNVVYHIKEDGINQTVYRKQILVPFGEFLPFAEFFNKMCPWLIDFMSGNYFKAGEEMAVFDTKAGKIGALICYESIFPEIAKEAVEKGAEALVIVSNDSWFQNTPAMREHYAHAILRAVESDRYVIRAGNTGISAIIDGRGRVVASIPENTSMAFQAAMRPKRDGTLYIKAGRVFVWVLCGMYILLILRRACSLIFSFFFYIIEKIKK